MFMFAYFNTVVDASIENELSVLSKIFVVSSEDHQEGLYNMVSMHVH